VLPRVRTVLSVGIITYSSRYVEWYSKFCGLY